MKGLRFLRSAGMEGSTGNLREFQISSANTNPIFTGDLVALNSGLLVEATGAANNNDFTALGVFQGCRYVDADGSIKYQNYWDGVAGRTNIVGFVALAAGASFLIKGQDGATYTQADIGRRKGVIYAAGVPRTGMSGVTLGAPGANVATGPLLVLSRVDIPDEGSWFEVALVRDQFGLKAA
jgi:hypothetical protein